MTARGLGDREDYPDAESFGEFIHADLEVRVTAGWEAGATFKLNVGVYRRLGENLEGGPALNVRES